MFKDFLTTEGERLLAKSIAGTATITFTKMMIGDGDRGASTRAITSLESPQMTLDIYSVLLTGDNNIEITNILESEAISQGFYFREKGIYATDGTTEILFMYGTSGSLAEWMENVDSAVFTRTIRTIVTLSNSDNVQITLQKGAYASSSDAENILTAIQNIKLDGDWAKYSQAESILSILDALVAAYTVARAGKLDNLDALVSSRAPANTALSNAVWTNARAALLDRLGYLDTTISSRAPASTALSNAVWTNARAGYIDNLVNGGHGLPVIANYAYNAMANVGNTADGGGGINTGTVMAKLNTLLDNISALRRATGYYKPSGTLRHSFATSEVATNSNCLKLGGFYAVQTGCIRVVSSVRTDGTSSFALLAVPRYNKGGGSGVSAGIEYLGTPRETPINFHHAEINSVVPNIYDLYQSNAATMVCGTALSTYIQSDVTLWVEKGQYVAFYLAQNKSGAGYIYCNGLNVYYDEVY